MTQHPEAKRLVELDPSSKLGQVMAAATRELPTEAQLAELRVRLESVLGPTNGMAALANSSAWPRLATIGCIGALIASGALALRRHAITHASNNMAAPSPVTAPDRVVPAVHGGAAPVIVPTQAAAEDLATSAAAEPAPSAPGNSLRDSRKLTPIAGQRRSESQLLEQARRVLNHDPAAALALTNQAAKLFPDGVLVQEREVIAIAALRRLNRTSEADSRAASFNKAFPGSAHERVIDTPSK